MARTELGMSSEEFWNLSWYDWVGWIGRINLIHRRREQDFEGTLQIARNWFAMYAAAHGVKGASPEDFLQPRKDGDIDDKAIQEQVAEIEKDKDKTKEFLAEATQRFKRKKK